MLCINTLRRTLQIFIFIPTQAKRPCHGTLVLCWIDLSQLASLLVRLLSKKKNEQLVKQLDF